MTIVLCIIAALGTACALVLYALKQNINLFYTPTELLTQSVSSEQNVRLGGYVEKHSVKFDPSGKHVDFVVSDFSHQLKVSYSGILPSLFREGQGVVMTGKLGSDHIFLASTVLAKHDEKYMPPSMAKALQGNKT